MTNFIKVDDQLKGIINLVEDDNQEQAVCCEAFKENVSVTYANLFEFNRHNIEVVIKDSPSQGSIDCECDHILRQSSFGSDDLASSTYKTSEKRAVSFAPSCQVIHIDNEGNQAYLCHEAVKECSSPQGCIGGEIGRILGLKKRRNVPQGSCYGDDVATYKTDKKRVVSFAPSCPTIHLVDNQTEGNEDELWYSQHDFMDFEDEACLCSHMIRDCESQGTFDGEVGHILGLEKIILCDSYLDRRDALRQTVLNEQAVQQLVKDLRSRQGCESDDDSNAEKISLMHLAATSERLSLWARERASMAAFTLEHDLATCEAQDLRKSLVTWTNTLLYQAMVH
ncbi:hypothetical protein QTG54_015876 [Skeletonema marinoi]|uniref:Uncharacterized protein n=1 Tax=Skeletonema marinoi TaxID=267567 RepID=A0AAD8XTB6_9STRA|nr:hypothetical protein QTG54_015876 [Skeletonema marinoi]